MQLSHRGKRKGKEVARPTRPGPLGKKILYCLRRRQPRSFDDLIRVYCKWRYGPARISPNGSVYQASKRSIQICVTNLAVQGLVRLTFDRRRSNEPRIALTDKGRRALKRYG